MVGGLAGGRQVETPIPVLHIEACSESGEGGSRTNLPQRQLEAGG